MKSRSDDVDLEALAEICNVMEGYKVFNPTVIGPEEVLTVIKERFGNRFNYAPIPKDLPFINENNCIYLLPSVKHPEIKIVFE